MFTDRIFLVDSENAVRLQSRVNKSPVYFYYFNYLGSNQDNKIVNHGSDSVYIYGDFFPTNISKTPDELKMKDILINSLLSFIQIGKPKIKGVDWEPTQYNQLIYLNITSPEDIKLLATDELTNSAFWISLGLKENENLVLVREEL